MGDQDERQLNQFIRDGQIRERDHREDQMRQLAEDSQLGQPSQGLRGNAGAGTQRGRRSSNARIQSGRPELAEEIIRSEEDAE